MFHLCFFIVCALCAARHDVPPPPYFSVQKNLTTMKDDCARITTRIGEAHDINAQRKKDNAARTMKGWGLLVASWFVISLFFYVAVLETAGRPSIHIHTTVTVKKPCFLTVTVV